MPQDTFLVESTLRRILSLARKKTVYTDILTASLITNLVTELMIQSMTDSRQIFVMPDYVNRSIEFLQAHFSEPLTLDTIAAYLNISKYHLFQRIHPLHWRKHSSVSDSHPCQSGENPSERNNAFCGGDCLSGWNSSCQPSHPVVPGTGRHDTPGIPEALGFCCRAMMEVLILTFCHKYNVEKD